MCLAKAGKGDTFLISGNNFPTSKLERNIPTIRLAGHLVAGILTEIMKLIKVSASGVRVGRER
jgi:L-fucose mutarotase/ribose pyranase (RbsD/FucU family)